MIVNNVLLEHFHGQTRCTQLLQDRLPNFSEKLQRLFSVRSDVQRLQVAAEVAQGVLSLWDYGEITKLHHALTTLELKREIRYPVQQDHTAHSVYTFLLGILVYDRVACIRNSIRSRLNHQDPDRIFLFQWTFASLLHDIGYVFSEHTPESTFNPAKFYNKMFSLDNVMTCSGATKQSSQKYLGHVWKSFLDGKFTGLNWPDTAERLLRGLNRVNWCCDFLDYNGSALELLRSDQDCDNVLASFAWGVAVQGYAECQWPIENPHFRPRKVVN